MEGSWHTRAPESLEDRIRRMALSSNATLENPTSVSRPVVRLPSTTDYNAQQSNPSPAVNSQWQPQSSINPVSASNRQSSESMRPSGSRQNGPQYPAHGPGQYASHSQYPIHSSGFGDNTNQPRNGRDPTAHHYASRGRGGQRQSQYQRVQIDPNAYQRASHVPNKAMHPRPPQSLYNPDQSRVYGRPDWREIRARQAHYLDNIASLEVPLVEMSDNERSEKEKFRQTLEAVCHEVCAANPERLPQVSLECFGSFQSGFASAGSDMDLVIVVKGRESESALFSLLEDDLPRALEQRLLQQGFGARLLTRTRVPIIKVCQSPGGSLLDKLRQEREKWDMLPNEMKYPHLHNEENEAGDDDAEVEKSSNQTSDVTSHADLEKKPAKEPEPRTVAEVTVTPVEAEKPVLMQGPSDDAEQKVNHQQQGKSKVWVRERRAGPLDFPKTGVGIQSDINFFNPLGLHNTHLLRCYSLCDPRVRPMILFVKAWAKRRKINSSYSGTLSSYGYVLMVLHYLVNVARPPVLPNLQQPWRPSADCTPQGASQVQVEGWLVDFWRSETEITNARQSGQLSANTESVGSLLAGFFQYYVGAKGGHQFRWTMQVLSLRTLSGIITKEEKGWVKATMEQGEGKKIQHRYLFCIEDPFEVTHNVARTVTHPGIVAIRDEFRRAAAILNAVAHGTPSHQGHLFDQLIEPSELPADLQDKTTGVLSMEFPATQPAQQPQASANQPVQSGKSIQINPKKNSPQQPQTKPPKTKADPRAIQTTSLDVTDDSAFPSLSSAKSKPSKKIKQGEISGDRAKAVLEEIRRKKAEAQAEATATNIAETALKGTD